MKRRAITPKEIEAAKTATGGFSAQQLKAWGVRCPPKSGWRRRILRDGVPATCRFPDGFEDAFVEIGPNANPLLAFGTDPVPVEMPADALMIYTDGSGDPNHGRGGWGFTVFADGVFGHEASGGETATTNNRMELQAVIQALQWLGAGRPAVVWTDSAYVVRGCDAWRRGWKRGNWLRAPQYANADLWATLEALLDVGTVAIRWTRAHAGTAGNERADALATRGRLDLPAAGRRGN